MATIKEIVKTNEERGQNYQAGTRVTETAYKFTTPEEYTATRTFAQNAADNWYKNSSLLDNLNPINKSFEQILQPHKDGGYSLNYEAVKVIFTKVLEEIGDGNKEKGLERFLDYITGIKPISTVLSNQSKPNFKIVSPWQIPHYSKPQELANLKFSLIDNQNKHENQKNEVTMQFEDSNQKEGLARPVYFNQIDQTKKSASIALYLTQILEKSYNDKITTNYETPQVMYTLAKYMIDGWTSKFGMNASFEDVALQVKKEIATAPQKQQNKYNFTVPNQENVENNLFKHSASLLETYKYIVHELHKTDVEFKNLSKLGIHNESEYLEIIPNATDAEFIKNLDIVKEKIFNVSTNESQEQRTKILATRKNQAFQVFADIFENSKFTPSMIKELSDKGIKYRYATNFDYDHSLAFPLEYMTEQRTKDGNPIRSIAYHKISTKETNKADRVDHAPKFERDTDNKYAAGIFRGNNIDSEAQINKDFAGNIRLANSWRDAFIFNRVYPDDICLVKWGNGTRDECLANIINAFPNATYYIDTPNTFSQIYDNKSITPFYDVKINKAGNLSSTLNFDINVNNPYEFDLNKFLTTGAGKSLDANLKNRIFITNPSYADEVKYYYSFSGTDIKVKFQALMDESNGGSIHGLFVTGASDEEIKSQSKQSTFREMYNRLTKEYISENLKTKLNVISDNDLRTKISSEIAELSANNPNDVSLTRYNFEKFINENPAYKHLCKNLQLTEQEVSRESKLLVNRFVDKMSKAIKIRDNSPERYAEISTDAGRNQTKNAELRTIFNNIYIHRPINFNQIKYSESQKLTGRVVNTQFSQEEVLSNSIEHQRIFKSVELIKNLLPKDQQTNKEVHNYISHQVCNAYNKKLQNVVDNRSEYFASQNAEKEAAKLLEIQNRLGAYLGAIKTGDNYQSQEQILKFMRGSDNKMPATEAQYNTLQQNTPNGVKLLPDGLVIVATNIEGKVGYEFKRELKTDITHAIQNPSLQVVIPLYNKLETLVKSLPTPETKQDYNKTLKEFMKYAGQLRNSDNKSLVKAYKNMEYKKNRDDKTILPELDLISKKVYFAYEGLKQHMLLETQIQNENKYLLDTKNQEAIKLVASFEFIQQNTGATHSQDVVQETYNLAKALNIPQKLLDVEILDKKGLTTNVTVREFIEDIALFNLDEGLTIDQENTHIAITKAIEDLAGPANSNILTEVYMNNDYSKLSKILENTVQPQSQQLAR